MVLENGRSCLMYTLLLAQVLLVAGNCPDLRSRSSGEPPLCLPCRVPEADPCIYDLSGCGYLPSGAICEVQCKEPYQGNATFAKCAANNTVEGLLLDWTPPSCSFNECPFPQTLPEGYERDAAGKVFCAAGYEGVPTRRCSLAGPQCALQTDVEGCRRLQSCQLREDQECPRLDYQKCAELSLGQSCRVNCLAPFEGPGFEVQCPAGNTEPNGEPLRLSEPNCTMPCPVPEPIPYGYTNRSGEWSCDEGYAGEAQLICVYDGFPICQRRVELRGCYRLMPCADLQLPAEADECLFNLTECQGVAPGQRCQLNCLTPFVDGGLPQFARCPAENVNPYMEPIYSELPRCILSCPDPPLPNGYDRVLSTFSGQLVYSCADGWVGQVSRSCIHFPNCSYEVRFEGCQRKVPCLPLEVDDHSCRMDVSACMAVAPGESCRIPCREPYLGDEGSARCPDNNVDPQRRLEPQLPSCRASCDDLPAGYMRTNEGWSCADGYGGVAAASRADCGAPLVLEGCRPLQPCAVPEVDPCKLDLSDCGEAVAPGGGCVVRCAEGVYEPSFAYATCPEGNVDPEHPVSYELSCIPKCPEPDPLPEEIAKGPEGHWVCAEGYIGNVSEECIISPDPILNCSGFLNLTGCLMLMPCAPLSLADPKYAAQCGVGLEPGESCSINCRDGLHGDPSSAKCPEDNVDPNAPPEVGFFPDCRLECDSAPLGYEKTREGWQCSPGYAGIPQASCRPSSRCGAELHLEGCNPIVPCLRPTFGADVCRFVADCPAELRPGDSCTVRCQLPYEGEAMVAHCPANNTRATGEALWARPNCSFHVCPDPEIYSVNYTKDPGSPVGWRCSDAMTGRAQKRCESAPSVPMDDAQWPQCLVQEGFLSGCGVPQPCVPIEASEMWEECRFDVSHCGEMVPNSFCEVKCRAPYVGSSTYARCATFNTDPQTPVEWTPPTCVMACPVPEPIPAGYVLNNDHWTCAPGYIGHARTRCQLGNGTCDAVQVLSGCDRLEACIRPLEAACSLNFSDCPDPLGQGEDCMVTCKRSYVGFLRPQEEKDLEEMENHSNFSNFSNVSNFSAMNFSNLSGDDDLLPSDGVIASCPAGNIIPGRVMDLPDLICVFQDCIDPEPIPLGYQKQEVNDTEEWLCADGFAGNASHDCRLRPDCVGEIFLSECIPVTFCSLGVLDVCLMDASACPEQLEPGSSCELRCPEPTQGAPGFASCPTLNTEAGAPAVIQPPSCQSPCEYLENVEVPFNFVSLEPLNLTGWGCAEGYGGNRSITCHIDRERDCNSSYVFDGCLPLTKCAGLENIDFCQYIHSCIPGLLPGEVCEIRCMFGRFTGDPVTAICSPENTDPLKPPQFAAWPTCVPICEEPTVAPTGYSLNRSADIEWTCAEGYLGTAVPSCGPDWQCVNRFSLSGCIPKVPCLAPTVPAGCLYDVSGCPSEILPGQSCQIECKSPYVGNSTSAYCDVDNTVVNALSQFELPECFLECGEIPADLTEAYVRTQAGGWECNSTGYLGTPATTCALEDGCTAVLRITGCLPIVRCISPDPRAFDVCQYNFSGCDTLAPGSSCNVSCEPPYIGGSTTATCPDLNVDPLRAIEFQHPNCTLLCPEPFPVPPGYVRTTEAWLCAEGYVGTAVASCLVDRFFSDSQGICITRTELSGCVPLQPCVFPSSDVCDFDTSNCSSVAAGATCQVFCRVPFSGPPSMGRCPADNTNPQTMVTVEMPTCILDCPIPETLPEGYNISWTAQRSDGLAVSIFGTDPISGRRARVERQGYFECDESFAGNLTVTCAVDPDCDWRIEFANCRPTVPCAPLDLNVPPCGLIAPDCDRVASGRSCMVTCGAPCTGESAELYCPRGNTNPDQPLMGERPNCLTECDFVPAGYRRSNSAENGWECANGYTGAAEVFCLPSGPGRVCETEILLQGCVEMVPCGPGNYDPCQYDMSDCMSVPRGESCTIRCNSVYTGMDFNATCPSANTQVNGGLQFEDGNCLIRECPEPNMTNGTFFPWEYVDENVQPTAGQAVQCRTGFAGLPQRQCVAVGSECLAEAAYPGCELIVPCRAPDLDFCRHEDVCGMVPAGGVCRTPCKFPFYGPAMTSTCPDNNTDPNTMPSVGVDSCQLGCEDPPQAPRGYIKVNGSWACASGWGGQATPLCILNETDFFNETCGSFLNLSGCFPNQPCVKPSALDSCTYQVDLALDAGVTSPVRCRYPPFNPEEFVQAGLRCPEDNIQVGREADILALPSCEMFCPSPAPPPGYVKSHDILSFGENGTGVEINRAPAYSCAAGWTGTANHSCMINRSDNQCAVPVTFQGCFQLVPCKPIDPRSFDVCTYNITECTERSQDMVGPYTGPMGGTTCELSCREPAIGDVTTASCQDLNIDPNRRMEYQLPTCSMYCPKPDVLPDGYEHLGTMDVANPSNEYRCASGYGGTASISCNLRGAYSSATETVQCSTITNFEGCLPLRSCRAPDVDSCRHDVWACRSLQAGQTCEVTCTPPLVGTPATFECPADNVVPDRVVLGQLPACRFPFGCEEPYPLTEGYVKVNETSYQCDEGYIGEAQWDCYLERLCSPVLVLSGCHKLVPCVIPAPEDQLCGLDYEACANLMGGQNCEVPCLPGFILSNKTSEEMNVTQHAEESADNASVDNESVTGNATSNIFTCPVNNIDPNQVILYDPPRCVFEACVDPDPVPEGYTKVDGNWSCAEGFVGEVDEDCNTCNASLTLSGCLSIKPCVMPQQPDQCMFDFSNCSNLAGDVCEIKCRAPYQGSSTFGRCPDGNIDASYEINVSQPDCRLVCPWPESIPLGYAWTNEGWQCSNGYHGVAQLECPISADCSLLPRLLGCNEPEPCSTPSFDRCQHVNVAPDCRDLPPSEACNLTCAAPYIGQPTMAECPYDNSNASLLPSLSAPRCVHPTCPDVVPPGYQKTSQGWRCATGFAGEPLQSCTSDEECCSLRLRLEGCRPIWGCKLPDLSEQDECRLDLSDCVNISSGGECEVRCRAPFFGVATSGSCEAQNTDPEKRLDFVMPFCQILRCDRPMPPPPGYVYNGLAELCAPGYTGSVIGQCRGGRPENHCIAPPKELSGCEPIEPCPLNVELDPCMMQSTCVNFTVESNASCEIQCLPPYSGASTMASCPPENVDPNRAATAVLPNCVLQCDPPAELPEGYEVVAGGWSCSEGFVGVAVGICVLDQASCTSSLQLSGCKKLQPCLAPGPPNPCMYDLSGCRDVQPGSFCRLFCKPPYAGGAPKLICPAGNTDPNYVMKWVEPYCFCTNPEQVPVGYEDDGQGGFRCSAGFVGAPQLRCQAARFECLQKSEIYGCVNPDVCHIMPFFDENDSPGVISGRVSFGPAMVQGQIDEEQVEGYDIFFADECDEVMGSAIASVDRTFLPAVGGCCEVMHYMVQLRDVWIPDLAVKLKVAVRGLITGQVVNLTDSDTGEVQVRPTTSIRKAATGTAVAFPRPAALLVAVWCLLMAWD